MKKRVLILGGIYEDFPNFFNSNKEKIYLEIVDIFREFKISKRKCMSFNLSTTIGGMRWDTTFKFYKEESIILKRDILPYFESIEDYESCEIINNIHKDLTNKN
jgi:hypothetical protein